MSEVALPAWVTRVRADNPGPMTLDGTNTWVLHGADGNVVVDPGPLDEAHLQAVAALGEVALVVLTHGHPDHAEGARRFHEITGAPVHARERALCLDAEPLWEDGEEWGTLALSLRTHHTPGHTADSISLLARPFDDEQAPPVLLTGDTVLGRGTTVVMHPDGRLGDYLSTLVRLQLLVAAHPGLVLLPGHGPVPDDAAALLDYYRAHRLERLWQVSEAVAAGATSAREVVEVVYADVDRAVWPAAELTVQAQLEYLAAVGPVELGSPGDEDPR